jgi:hypothetical protein
MANLLGAEALFSMSIPFSKIADFLDKAPFYPFDEFEVSKNLDIGLESQVIADFPPTEQDKGEPGKVSDAVLEEQEKERDDYLSMVQRLTAEQDAVSAAETEPE